EHIVIGQAQHGDLFVDVLAHRATLMVVIIAYQIPAKSGTNCAADLLDRFQ
ncbi:MAG: hypothetical protein RL029_842, partial [Actinomycetota bacterium]